MMPMQGCAAGEKTFLPGGVVSEKGMVCVIPYYLMTQYGNIYVGGVIPRSLLKKIHSAPPTIDRRPRHITAHLMEQRP